VAALRLISRQIVDGERPSLRATARTPNPSARSSAISSRSANDRYRPDGPVSVIEGMPPRSRNHRDPTGPDTPHATAASSLVIPPAILTQNARSMSRRIGGRPGDRIAGRPVRVTIHPGCRPMNTSDYEVLRQPVESTQFTSVRFTERLEEIGARPSIGTVADSFDNALAETTNGLYKTESVYRPDAHGWDDVDELELATLSWVHWFNETRLHGHCNDVPPAEHEAAFYAAQQDQPDRVGIQ
jgi:putative transposase